MRQLLERVAQRLPRSIAVALLIVAAVVAAAVAGAVGAGAALAATHPAPADGGTVRGSSGADGGAALGSSGAGDAAPSAAAPAAAPAARAAVSSRADVAAVAQSTASARTGAVAAALPDGARRGPVHPRTRFQQAPAGSLGLPSPGAPDRRGLDTAPAGDMGTGAGGGGAAGGAADGPRLIVKTVPGATLEAAADPAVVGAVAVRRVPQLDLTILTFPDNASAAAAKGRLEGETGVAWVSPERTRTFALTPNDPYYSAGADNPGQWGFPRVGLPSVWDLTQGSSTVKLAILDTGIAIDIPDFQGRITDPYSVLAHSTVWPAWEDQFGHGSGVAGVAAAMGNNGFGIAGAAWNVKIMPVKISDGKEFDTGTEVEGIVWAVDHGADVINISAGYPEYSREEQEAVTYALSRGVVVVAAAGNHGPGTGVDYPAGLHGVIAVGATTGGDQLASFSCTGWELDVVAPGESIVTYNLDEKSYWMAARSGTSFAAPLVSGTAALLLSLDPALTPARLASALDGTAKDLGSPGFDVGYGFGLLDAGSAATRVKNDPSPPLPDLPLTFPDVPADSPYAPAIARLADEGAVVGYGNGRFGYQDLVRRQQFAKMILLALNKTPTEANVSPFKDVPPVAGDLYPDNYVALAASLGITTGVSTNPPRFDPFGQITRGQVVTMVVRAADSLHPGALSSPPAGYVPPFGRFSPAHDAAAAKASWNGLLDGLVGVGPGYSMWGPATRAEVAAVLAALLSLP